MPPLYRSFLPLFLICSITCSITGWAASAGDELNGLNIHFKPLCGSLILLPVLVNGTGPFDFILDTGTTATLVDPELAAQLSLPSMGQTTNLDLQSSSLLPIARASELEVGGAKVRNLDVLVPSMAGLKSFDGKVRGILGENFLGHFDIFLDNQHHQLRLQPAQPGSPVEDLEGERIPLRDHGSAAGQPTSHRLLLTVKAPDLGPNEMTFALDSGASTVVLFRNAHTWAWLSRREHLGASGLSVGLQASAHPVNMSSLQALTLGRRVLANLATAVPTSSPPADSDGLLPTCIFHSVYISHSRGFAIFDPVIRRPHAR